MLGHRLKLFYQMCPHITLLILLVILTVELEAKAQFLVIVILVE